jgi:large subunit ribosomal protein L24
MAEVMKLRIKKGDRVRVLQGKDRGKEGEIVRAIPSKGTVVVAGVNIAKKHQRPYQRRSGDTSQIQQGGIIDKDMPIPVANVALICPNCGATRVGYRLADNGVSRDKVRVCKKCGAEL